MFHFFPKQKKTTLVLFFTVNYDEDDDDSIFAFQEFLFCWNFSNTEEWMIECHVYTQTHTKYANNQ